MKKTSAKGCLPQYFLSMVSYHTLVSTFINISVARFDFRQGPKNPIEVSPSPDIGEKLADSMGLFAIPTVN